MKRNRFWGVKVEIILKNYHLRIRTTSLFIKKKNTNSVLLIFTYASIIFLFIPLKIYCRSTAPNGSMHFPLNKGVFMKQYSHINHRNNALLLELRKSINNQTRSGWDTGGEGWQRQVKFKNKISVPVVCDRFWTIFL